MNVSVMREKTRSRVVSTAEIQQAAETLLRTLKLPKAELSVVLCDDATIHTLNRDYRRKDKPTDVLAFALREGPGGHLAGDLLGDVIISLDTATRQAKERAIATRDEVRMLLAHGLLHLLGWDHRTDAEDRRMRAETDRLLAALARAETRASKKTTTKKTTAKKKPVAKKVTAKKSAKKKAVAKKTTVKKTAKKKAVAKKSRATRATA
jgi:probable rRNA maturation factor